MDEEALQRFADQLEVPTEQLMERWQGRPDLVIDDIFRVRDIDTGEVRDLELFDVQRRVVHAYFYGDAGTLNTYKGRRIGYSFIFCACFLLEAMFYPYSFYPLVSRSLSQSKNRISDIQNLIDHAKIDIPTNKENTDYIELWNESAFQAYSADSDVSRGDRSGRAVLMDEMAFMEDEEQANRAFGAFLALGENRKKVQVSTPNTKNDLFMQEHRRGSEDGENGVIAIRQPTFENAGDIDIHTPLHEQRTVPVRPEINIDQIETERLADPKGFGQEYLCRPVVDEYRFFDEDSIQLAMEKSHIDYKTGLDAPIPTRARRIMGIDLAAGVEGGDDTVISVMDHIGSSREQRFIDAVDEDLMRRAQVPTPDPGNPSDIADLIKFVNGQMDVDGVILDKGGVGQGFNNEIHRTLGRKVVGFDFSDSEAVNDMFGDANRALRQENVVLVDNDRLADEMASIVKQKKEDWSVPHYSGKDNSESGKDDMAMATVLSMFPPHLREAEATAPAEKPRTEGDKQLTRKERQTGELQPAHGAAKMKRSSRQRTNLYGGRHARYR